MSNLTVLILSVIALAIVGSLTMILMAKKYYWGVRGAPPPSREERRRMRREGEKDS